jgi:gamma-glutamyltranspeptidase/glutathione hydrolase
MARGPRDAISNHPVAQDAADECLLAGGTAVDAVLAAYFALAGATPWALLAPLTILVAGSGSGVRAVDGRARQPGLGIERPVRYSDEAAAPLLARASAPATAAAVSVASSMFGHEPLPRLATLGARIARKQGARERAALITRFGSARAWVLQDRTFLAEVAERVPRFEGALLQPADLAIEGADVLPCEPSLKLAGVQAALPPWHDLAAPSASSTDPSPLLVLASERGNLAALFLHHPGRAIPLFEGEVELPAVGQPVLRGVPRLKPGSPLPLAVPLAVLLEDARATHVVGATVGEQIREEEVEMVLTQEGQDGLTRRAGALLAARCSG